MKFKFILPVLAILLMLAAWFTIFGAETFSSEGDVSIAVTGDVMFARNMHNVLSLGTSPFEGVSNVTSNVDLLLINFENAATSSQDAVKPDIPLKCNPHYAVLAHANNNTVAALANNHVCDYGIRGMQDTVNALNEANITPIGAGNNEDEAHRAVTQQINGRQITILNYMDANNFAEYSYGVLPYANGSSPGYSAYDSIDAKNQIEEAKENGSFVIIFMHYGNEYHTSPNDDQINISHQLIDYGADIVIGSHPHVAQGIEMYNGKPIFYSLGDFIFDLQREGTLDTYFVQIDLVGDEGICTVYPVHLNNYLPQYMDSDAGNAFLNSLTPKTDALQINDGVGKLNFTLN
ncbi:MAG: CapA family protein [Methanobrevibacter sp.]|nr:CapA family protein [Methanobrevibacter sp.]